jgi:hypothetical protein
MSGELQLLILIGDNEWISSYVQFHSRMSFICSFVRTHRHHTTVLRVEYRVVLPHIVPPPFGAGHNGKQLSIAEDPPPQSGFAPFNSDLGKRCMRNWRGTLGINTLQRCQICDVKYK